MAFMRYAAAVVVQPEVSSRGWSKVRKASATPSRNLVAQASEILGKPFNPDDYLLTHCTIVASVDTDAVPNVRLGRVKVGSKTINRKYGNYFIQPQCSKYVNNNGDSWARDVLLASYPTFIGAHNFLEHVQIEEQSKGRIIDAVARDLGDSVYIDILVATDRRHAQLCQDIESGKIATLSMGCSVEETICTKCGNVAVDETELCDCIKYAKLNTFIDDQGKKRVIAELCGHMDLGDTGGVTFIEASWVSTPAFTGAVLRNILEPTQMPESLARRLQAVLASPPPQWGGTGTVKAAGMSAEAIEPQEARVVGRFTDRRAQWGDEPEEGGEAEAPAKEEAKAPLDTLVDEVFSMVTERVKEKVEQEMKEKETDEALSPEASSTWTNDTVVKQGHRKAAARAYQGAVEALVRTASSDVAFVDGLATVNASFGIQVPREMYRAALSVGPANRYKSMGQFLHACRSAAGRTLTPAETRTLVRIGKLLTRVGSTNLPAHRKET